MIKNFFSNFRGFFNKKNLVPCLIEQDYDTSMLDSSLELLNTTSKELIEVAGTLHNSLKQELKDTQLRLYSIMDSIEDFVLVKDAGGRWVHLNKYGERLYKFEEYDYKDKTNEELSKEFPHFTNHFFDCLHTDELAWKNRLPTRSEEMLGNKTFDLIKTPVFNFDGSKKELIVIGRDITEVKEKRKRIKACFNALNASSDVIVITDYNSNIIFCNDKFIQKFGFNSYEEIVHKSLDIISSTQNPNFYHDVCHKQIKQTWHGSSHNKKVDGTLLNCSLTVLPVMNGVDYPIYYIYTMKAIN